MPPVTMTGEPLPSRSPTAAATRCVGVGGGLRYQSDVVLGFRPSYVDPSNPSKGVTYDLGDPYRGPSETAIDVWASYRRKLTSKIEWVVQLNIRNLNYGGDALVPVNSQPTPYGEAAYRIRRRGHGS